MKDYQKSLKSIDLYLTDKSVTNGGVNFDKELDDLQELVDKEKPMKIDRTKNPDWFAVCPRCHACLGVVEEKKNYCPNCGQRLDWKEKKCSK